MRKKARYIWKIICQYTGDNISFRMKLRSHLAEAVCASSGRGSTGLGIILELCLAWPDYIQSHFVEKTARKNWKIFCQYIENNIPFHPQPFIHGSL